MLLPNRATERAYHDPSLWSHCRLAIKACTRKSGPDALRFHGKRRWRFSAEPEPRADYQATSLLKSRAAAPLRGHDICTLPAVSRFRSGQSPPLAVSSRHTSQGFALRSRSVIQVFLPDQAGIEAVDARWNGTSRCGPSGKTPMPPPGACGGEMMPPTTSSQIGNEHRRGFPPRAGLAGHVHRRDPRVRRADSARRCSTSCSRPT